MEIFKINSASVEPHKGGISIRALCLLLLVIPPRRDVFPSCLTPTQKAPPLPGVLCVPRASLSSSMALVASTLNPLKHRSGPQLNDFRPPGAICTRS